MLEGFVVLWDRARNANVNTWRHLWTTYWKLVFVLAETTKPVFEIFFWNVEKNEEKDKMKSLATSTPTTLAATWSTWRSRTRWSSGRVHTRRSDGRKKWSEIKRDKNLEISGIKKMLPTNIFNTLHQFIQYLLIFFTDVSIEWQKQCQYLL